MALIKDYCIRNKICLAGGFKKFFDDICEEFSELNTSEYIIEKNQKFAKLEKNYAFIG